jgi:F0F1-type ATP synthase assembly protein I
MTDPREAQREKELTTRRAGAAYQGAFESVFSILIGAGLGYWADHAFGTFPRYLFIGLAIGFGAFVLRLYRLGRKLQALVDSAKGGEQR